MIATGLVLFFVGFVLVRFFGAQGADAYLRRYTWVDSAGLVLLIIGSILLVVGAFIWVWRNLP